MQSEYKIILHMKLENIISQSINENGKPIGFDVFLNFHHHCKKPFTMSFNPIANNNLKVNKEAIYTIIIKKITT